MHRRLAIVPLTLTLILAGCSAAEAEPQPEPTVTSQPSQPAAEPQPTAEPTPEPLTCDTLLRPESSQWLLDSGLEGPADEFERGVDDPVLLRFSELGGLLCTWAVPDSGVIATYGHSPITATDSATIQSELVARGFERSDEGGMVIFRFVEKVGDSELTDWAETYAFTDSEWFYTMGSPTDLAHFAP